MFSDLYFCAQAVSKKKIDGVAKGVWLYRLGSLEDILRGGGGTKKTQNLWGGVRKKQKFWWVPKS